MSYFIKYRWRRSSLDQRWEHSNLILYITHPVMWIMRSNKDCPEEYILDFWAIIPKEIADTYKGDIDQ